MTTQKPYDPNLRDAAREIRAILSRRKIGGTYTLSSKTHSEFGDFPPEWCTVKYGIEKQAVRVRLTCGSDPALANASAGHVFGTRDALVRLAHFYIELAEALQAATGGGIDHTVATGDAIYREPLEKKS